MAATLLRVNQRDEYLNLFIQTQVTDDDQTVVINIVDNDLKVIDGPVYQDLLQEEAVFHTELRKKAAENGDLITSHSTNPEWNPEGYTKTLDQALENEKSGK